MIFLYLFQQKSYYKQMAFRDIQFPIFSDAYSNFYIFLKN